MAALPRQPLVLQTDVTSSYASMDQQRFLDRLAVHLTDQTLLPRIGQDVRRSAERGGLWWDHTQGRALGRPLRPLRGAFCLTEVDEALERLGRCARRSMGDLLVLAPTPGYALGVIAMASLHSRTGNCRTDRHHRLLLL